MPKISNVDEIRPKMFVEKGGNVTFSGKIYNGVGLLYNKDWYYLSGLTTGKYPSINKIDYIYPRILKITGGKDVIHFKGKPMGLLLTLTYPN